MADRYWVGGTGNWNTTSTTNWSATSGGGGGASIPTASDNVFFNSASGSGTYTVTLTTASLACLNLNIAKPATGNLITTSVGIVTIAGNLIANGANVTWGGTGVWNFTATTAKSITSGGLTLPPLNFNGAAGSWALQDNVTIASTANVTLTQGTLDLNNNVLSTGIFITAGASTKVLAFGTSSVSLTGNNATILNLGTITGLTFTGTPVFNCTYSGATGTRTITSGAFTEAQSPSINITAGTDAAQVTGSVLDLNTTGFSGTFNSAPKTIYGNLTISTGMTFQAGVNAVTFAATSGTKTITTAGKTTDAPFTFSGVGGTWQLIGNLNLNTTATSNLTLTAGNLDLNNYKITAPRVIATGTSVRGFFFGNSGVMNLTATGSTLWSAATVTNFSYTGNARVNLTGNVATATIRTLFHGNSAGGSDATKAPPFYVAAAGSDTIATSDAQSYLSDLVFLGTTVGLQNQARVFYGNFILGKDMNFGVGTATQYFYGNTTQIFDSGNFSVPINCPFTVGSGVSTGTLTLANATTIGVTRPVSLFSGTLDANGKAFTIGSFISTGNVARTLNISNSTLTLSSDGNIWDTSTAGNLTITAANSNIVISNTSANVRTLSIGNGTVFSNVVIGANTSTGNTYFAGNGNVTIGSLTSTRTVAQVIKFAGSANTNYTINNWGIVGTSGAPVTVTNDGTATPAKLIYGGAGNVNVSYHTISYSSASPADTWYSLLTNNNVDGGNTTGWIFTYAAPSSSNFFLVF